MRQHHVSSPTPRSIKVRRNTGPPGRGPLAVIVLLGFLVLNLALLYFFFPRAPTIVKLTRPPGTMVPVPGGHEIGGENHVAFFQPGRTFAPKPDEVKPDEEHPQHTQIPTRAPTERPHPRDPHPEAPKHGEDDAGGRLGGAKADAGSPFYARDKTLAWSYESMEEMLEKTVPKKHWKPSVEEKPETYESARKLEEHTGCDIITVPFSPTSDKHCLDFLTDPKNWKELRPLDMEFDSRTIKFKIIFDIPEIDPVDKKPIHKLETILKVPQRLFPNEAFSEVASYHADRVLLINRVPPVGWVCIPSPMIHEAMDKHGSTVRVVDEFLKDSGVKNYSDWINKDMFEYAKYNKGLMGTSPGGEPCVGASIQLFMADVGHLLDSVLKIPYIPHNASWMRYFDMNGKDKPSFLEERWSVSMVHLSEIATYDYVIGNGDRSPNKNNFVVGGCRRYCGSAAAPPHPQWPTYVHLDQGMGFYGSPHNNAISKGSHGNKMCIFRLPLMNRIKELVEPAPKEDDYLFTEKPGATKKKSRSRFHSAMVKRLPAVVLEQVNQYRLGQATDRMKALLKIVDKCLNRENPFWNWVLAP